MLGTVTEFAVDDALSIRAGMEALEAARQAAWKRPPSPPSNLCECSHPATHLHRSGTRVCSGCLKPKLGVL